MASLPVREVPEFVSQELFPIVSRELSKNLRFQNLNYAPVENLEDLERIETNETWALKQQLLSKFDHLGKRGANSGLITVNSNWNEVKDFVKKFTNKKFMVGGTMGKLKTFLGSPFVRLKQNEESYMCIYSGRDDDYILFNMLVY